MNNLEIHEKEYSQLKKISTNGILQELPCSSGLVLIEFPPYSL